LKPEVAARLETLRTDFAKVVGQTFVHFFCPLLFKDESAPLCQAHVVNVAFPESSRRWTIQRQDVDSFYGSVFESEFLDLRHRRDGIAADAFGDPFLYKRLRPRILLDGREIGHFVAKGRIPSQFSLMELQSRGTQVLLGLKLSPAQVASSAGGNWQVDVLKDIRLAAIVSVLKAAHLTLFEMLGYRYALSLGGQYLGQLLGEFFLQNVGRSKRDVLNDAAAHFRPFVTMVRPIAPGSLQMLGTIDNSSIRVCWCEDGKSPLGRPSVRANGRSGSRGVGTGLRDHSGRGEI
jgi:hypothetical protein